MGGCVTLTLSAQKDKSIREWRSTGDHEDRNSPTKRRTITASDKKSQDSLDSPQDNARQRLFGLFGRCVAQAHMRPEWIPARMLGLGRRVVAQIPNEPRIPSKLADKIEVSLYNTYLEALRHRPRRFSCDDRQRQCFVVFAGSSFDDARALRLHGAEGDHFPCRDGGVGEQGCGKSCRHATDCSPKQVGLVPFVEHSLDINTTKML